MAASQSERIRGTVKSVKQDDIVLETEPGHEVKTALNPETKYITVVNASLSNVEKGSFIGAETKNQGDFPIALVVAIFPPSLHCMAEGHYAWDKLPDTTT